MGGEFYNDRDGLGLNMNPLCPNKKEFFYDFITLLISNIRETYLGNEFIKTDDDIKGHFKWCVSKTVDHFRNERIIFKNDVTLPFIFFVMNNVLYKLHYNEKSLDVLEKKMNIIFNEECVDKNELDYLYNLYYELENCLNYVF